MKPEDFSALIASWADLNTFLNYVWVEDPVAFGPVRFKRWRASVEPDGAEGHRVFHPHVVQERIEVGPRRDKCAEIFWFHKMGGEELALDPPLWDTAGRESAGIPLVKGTSNKKGPLFQGTGFP